MTKTPGRKEKLEDALIVSHLKEALASLPRPVSDTAERSFLVYTYNKALLEMWVQNMRIK